jgi:hypothetical protein
MDDVALLSKVATKKQLEWRWFSCDAEKHLVVSSRDTSFMGN